MTHTSSYRRILHKMGYYDYQHGLIYRHIKQQGRWDKHLERCRNMIIRAIDQFKPEKITVLGSGWLLELPLAEMIERTQKIVLVDIVHPPEVITQTAEYTNIHIVEEDVTGGLIELIWKKAGNRTFLNRLRSLTDIVVPEYTPGSDPGMVISLNILTQLEILPLKLLRRKCRKAAEDDFMTIRKEVQNNHIRFLENHKSILISDIAEIFKKAGGDTYENSTVVVELPRGKEREEWSWDFDLTGTDYNRKNSVFKIAAILI